MIYNNTWGNDLKHGKNVKGWTIRSQITIIYFKAFLKIKIDLKDISLIYKMEKIVENLCLHQRSHIEESNTLGLLSKDKITYIIQKTDLDLNNINLDFREKCWLWNGLIPHNEKGHSHGKIWFKGNYRYVHRLMYHNFIGCVPEFQRSNDTLQVNHSCSHEQNGRCINPWHLYLGTPKQNTKDTIIQGTAYSKKKYVKFDEVKNKLIELREQDKTLKEIYTTLEISSKTLNKWINKLDLKKEKIYDDLVVEHVIEMKQNKKTIEEITQETGVSKSTILRWMRKNKTDNS